MTYCEYDQALQNVETAKTRLVAHHRTALLALPRYYMLLCGSDENRPSDPACSAGRNSVNDAEKQVQQSLERLYAATLAALHARTDRIRAAGWQQSG